MLMKADIGNNFKFQNNEKIYIKNELRVPLIMRFPEKLPQNIEISQQVSLIDIYRTLGDLIGEGKFHCNEASDRYVFNLIEINV